MRVKVGDHSQRQRARTMKRFRRGHSGFNSRQNGYSMSSLKSRGDAGSGSACCGTTRPCRSAFLFFVVATSLALQANRQWLGTMNALDSNVELLRGHAAETAPPPPVTTTASAKAAATENQKQEPKAEANEIPIQQQNEQKKRTHTIKWNGLQAMEAFAQPYFNDRNLFCESINEARKNASDPALPVTVDITFGCRELFREGGFGTGNYISTFYGIRLATKIYEDVDVRLTCSDAEESKKNLILPWLTGYFPARKPGTSNPFSSVTLEQACSTYQNVPIGLLHQEMQYDFRRMAVALVGIPGAEHPSAQFAEQSLWSNNNNDATAAQMQLAVPQKDAEPVYRQELDDAVIHFRCGDLMDSDHPNFGFMRFKGYTQYISPEARSIGILTQPFADGGQARGADASSAVRDRCRIVVTALVDYIQERHPKSRIRIHNGPEETIALAYARMIMANETIAGISTFGVFPVLSTFGRGYLRSPEYPTGRGPNMWTLKPRLDTLVNNLHLVVEKDRIMVADIRKLWETGGKQAVVAWFKNEPATEQKS